MGVIIRQGVVSGIILYAGAALGFVISVLLFPKTLGTEVYGFSQWLVFLVYSMFQPLVALIDSTLTATGL